MRTRNLVLILIALVLCLAAINPLLHRGTSDQVAASAQGAARGNAGGNGNGNGGGNGNTNGNGAQQTTVTPTTSDLTVQTTDATADVPEQTGVVVVDGPLPEKKKFWVLTEDEILRLFKR